MRAIVMPRNPTPALPSDGLLALRQRAEHAHLRAQECAERSMTLLAAAYEEEARSCESALADLLTRAYLAIDVARMDAEAAGKPHCWSDHLSPANAALVDQAAHYGALYMTPVAA